jgi:hypothetical protein
MRGLIPRWFLGAAFALIAASPCVAEEIATTPIGDYVGLRFCLFAWIQASEPEKALPPSQFTEPPAAGTDVDCESRHPNIFGAAGNPANFGKNCTILTAPSKPAIRING